MRAFVSALVLASTFLASTAFAALDFPFVPDPTMTEGSLCDPRDPDFERYRYQQKIAYCQRNVSRETKTRIYEVYGVPAKCRGEYTIDHFIPLSIGGDNSVANLWPEHKSIKALRKELETELYKNVSSGAMSQDEAVKIITEAKWNPPVSNPRKFKFCGSDSSQPLL